MTVAIAAIAEDGRSFVFAADRLAANSHMNYLVSTNAMKIHGLGLCACLSSGSQEDSHRILNRVEVPDTVEDLADACVREVRCIREEAIDKFRRRAGLSKFESWLEGRSNRLTTSFLIDFLNLRAALAPMARDIYEFKVEIQLIVAGFSKGGAKLGFVEDPGTLAWCEGRSYHTNGIGGHRAAESLLLHEYQRNESLASVLFKVYVAKRQAEATLGVGGATDMAILEEGKTLRLVSESVCAALSDEYERTHSVVPDLTRIVQALNET